MTSPSPAPRGPSKDAVDALRAAVASSLHVEPPRAEVGPAVRRLVHEARADGYRAEEVVVLVKHLCESVPGWRRAQLTMGREFGEQVVAGCIADYYQGSAGDGQA